MPNIRRLYLYLASALSLLLFLSGGISLARLLFSGSEAALPSEQLALALAYILVGLASLVGHWGVLQRRLAQHPAEISSPERVIFLYSLLLATLFTAILNVLTLLNQLILGLLGVPVELALLGDGQPLSELLATILLCSLAAAYIFHVLQQDSARSTPQPAWERVRQGYRYAWLLFSLSLLLLGLQQTIQFILQISLLSGAAERAALGNGLAFILIAAPLWAIFERSIQKDIPSLLPEDQLVRLTFNAGIYLLLTVCLLFYAGAIIGLTLQLFWNGARAEWLAKAATPLSIALPLAAVWYSYQRKISQELGTHLLDSNRAYILRTLRYSFAWIGIVTAFAGFQILIVNLINLAVAGNLLDLHAWSNLQSTQIARAMAALVFGLPLWLVTWRKVSLQARLDNELSDSSQWMRPRQLYLSAVVLFGVLGFLASAGWLIYQAARVVLDGTFPSGLVRVLAPLVSLALFVLLLAYHYKLQQADQRQTARHRSRKYALFPVLVLAPDAPPADTISPANFGALVASALEREMPGLPIAVHAYTSGAPDETLSTAKAVIMPSQLLTKPPESILLWLQGYSGAKLVISESTRDWYWPGIHHSLAYLARLTARKVRILAEQNDSLRV